MEDQGRDGCCCVILAEQKQEHPLKELYHAGGWYAPAALAVEHTFLFLEFCNSAANVIYHLGMVAWGHVVRFGFQIAKAALHESYHFRRVEFQKLRIFTDVPQQALVGKVEILGTSCHFNILALLSELIGKQREYRRVRLLNAQL